MLERVKVRFDFRFCDQKFCGVNPAPPVAFDFSLMGRAQLFDVADDAPRVDAPPGERDAVEDRAAFDDVFCRDIHLRFEQIAFVVIVVAASVVHCHCVVPFGVVLESMLPAVIAQPPPKIRRRNPPVPFVVHVAVQVVAVAHTLLITTSPEAKLTCGLSVIVFDEILSDEPLPAPRRTEPFAPVPVEAKIDIFAPAGEPPENCAGLMTIEAGLPPTPLAFMSIVAGISPPPPTPPIMRWVVTFRLESMTVCPSIWKAELTALKVEAVIAPWT